MAHFRLTSLLSLVLAGSFVVTGCAATPADGPVQEASAVENTDLEIAKVPVAGPDDPADKYLLKVTVGTISESRFNELHERFGTEPGRYDAAKSYLLEDFFPSFARAVIGKTLEPYTSPADATLLAAMSEKEMANTGEAHVDANCHSVTWQWINFLQGTGDADAVLTLADGDVLLQRTEGFKTIAEADLRAGDIYLVEGKGGIEQSGAILHSGVVLGDGLVFEKANPGEEFPYRIAYLEDIVAKYRRVDGNSKVLYRRPAASPILPTLAEELSILSRKEELGLTGVSDEVLSQHILQEEFNFEEDRSDFTIGRILFAADAPADKLRPVSR